MPGEAPASTAHDSSGRHGSAGQHGGADDWSREAFVEEVGLVWEAAGSSRMDGRIIAYLLITDVPYVSSAALARALRVSAGSVSLATRRLVEAGFIRRHAVPGERSHYFRADDDVWGSFLAGERRHLNRQEQLAERALALLGPEEEAPRRRLGNMRDYMRWLRDGHHELLAQWRTYRSQAADQTTDQATDRPVDQAVGQAAGLQEESGRAGREPLPASAPTDEEEIGDRLSATLSPVMAQRLVPDALWAAAEPLLGAGVGSANERAAFTAVVYVLTSGCGWQQLPAQFGISHSTAHRRFTAWSRADLWQRWLDSLSAASVDAADLDWCSMIVKSAVSRRPAGGS
ncbi:DNA-binding transcriptional regulator GbsR (MarR family)/transposase [Streptomyces aurantiacus]|nr:transposase [Streptomyces aurantiacus]MDQ0779571.1 DNA-binding transcriptional regulator GbsR (MarR family)/transposase [Streptomyces aurantiacus]